MYGSVASADPSWRCHWRWRSDRDRDPRRPRSPAEIADEMRLSEEVRTREEDPFTDRISRRLPVSVIVHRSRFEVDLNRRRDERSTGDPTTPGGSTSGPAAAGRCVERSLPRTTTSTRRSRPPRRVAARGPFVVLDLHSYNHRRDGRDAPPAPVGENPDVNVGTGTRRPDRFGRLVDTFVGELRGIGSSDVGSTCARTSGSAAGTSRMGERALPRSAGARSRSSSRRRSWTSGRAPRRGSLGAAAPDALGRHARPPLTRALGERS